MCLAQGPQRSDAVEDYHILKIEQLNMSSFKIEKHFIFSSMYATF